MTVIQITVEDKKKDMYIDGLLNSQIDKNIKPNVKKKDKDAVYIVDGEEGSGKSVFAMQLAKKLDSSFNIGRVCFDSNEFTKAIIKGKKGQAIVFDEAYNGLSSRGALSEVNRLLVSLMTEMRQNNLFVIIVLPTFFLLDKYVALWRAKGLFHVYTKKQKRGYWMFFNKKAKKILYLTGKKFYSYVSPRSSFKGRFFDIYSVNEEEYRKRKKQCMNKKSRTTRAETYLKQRNILLWIIFEKFKQNHTQISRLCYNQDWKIDRSTITETINNYKKELLEKEALEEIRREEEEQEEENMTINSKRPEKSVGVDV